MRRKLNVKLVGFVFGGLLITAIGVHLLHGFQLSRNAHQLLERADQALAERDLDRALTLYEQYLGFMPNDVDTAQKYAQTLDQQAGNAGDRVRLVVLMEQVLRVKPGEHALRMRLVHNLIALGRIPEAADQLKKLQNTWSDKADLMHMIGWCEDAEKNHVEAVRAFEEAIKLNPKQRKSYDVLAEVLQERLNQPDDARKVMDDMVHANGDSWQAYLLRGRFHRRRGEAAPANADLERAYKLGNDEPEVLLEVADARRARGELVAAIELLQTGAKANPTNTRFYADLARIKMQANKPAEALCHIEDGLRHSPKSTELVVLAIDLMIDLKQYVPARQKLDGLIQSGVAPALPRYLQARLLVANGKWSDAIGLLEQANRELPPRSEWSARVSFLLGLCHRQLGDHERAAHAFRRATLAEPAWTLAAVRLGETLLDLELIEDASQVLEPLHKTTDAPAGYWRLLTRCRLQQQLRLPPAKRAWENVDGALAKVDAKHFALAQAEVLAAKGDLASAQAVLSKSGDSNDLAALCLRADLSARQGKLADAERMLEDAAAKIDFADRLEWRLALARLWGTRGTKDDRAKLDHLADRMTKSMSVAERVRLWRELTDIWMRLNDRRHAEALTERVAKALPGDLKSRTLLFESALQKNRLEAAKRWRDAIRAIEGAKGALWRWADAALLVHGAHGRRDQLATARAKLKEIDAIHKDWPRALVLSATIHELEGNTVPAIAAYARALELGDTSPRVLGSLLALLAQRRDFARAEAEITRYEQKKPLPKKLTRLAAQIALGMGEKRYARIALERAERAVESPPRDYRDALWLARICRAAGETARAEELLRSALTMAGHAPDAWVAWMDFLGTNDRIPEAVKDLERMKKESAASRRALTLARCYDALRLAEQADRAFQHALAETPLDFVALAYAAEYYRKADRGPDARKLYERLLTPDTMAPADVQEDARRQLAVLLGIDGAASKAMALLDANRDTMADRRVRMFLRSLDPGARLHVIDQFQASLREQPGTPEDRLLLAAMYEAAGQLGPARTLLAELSTQDPREARYLYRNARLLVRMDDVDEAERALKRLHELEPNSHRVRDVRAAIAQARQK